MLTIEIKVKGTINTVWEEWFREFKISHTEQGESILRGKVQDTAAMYGLMAKLRDLGLTILSIQTSGVGDEAEPGNI